MLYIITIPSACVICALNQYGTSAEEFVCMRWEQTDSEAVSVGLEQLLQAVACCSVLKKKL